MCAQIIPQKFNFSFNNKIIFFIYRTKWKRQTSVGFELLVEAGNYAAYQRAYRSNYPSMPDAWQYPASMLAAAAAGGGAGSPAELYYRQASMAALQGHSPYSMYPGAAAAAAAAAAMNLPKSPVAYPMFNAPVTAGSSTSPLSGYYQNVQQRLPAMVHQPTAQHPISRPQSLSPSSTAVCLTRRPSSSSPGSEPLAKNGDENAKNQTIESDNDDEDEHIEV